MTDIVERLRSAAYFDRAAELDNRAALETEAVTEIERLQAGVNIMIEQQNAARTRHEAEIKTLQLDLFHANGIIHDLNEIVAQQKDEIETLRAHRDQDTHRLEVLKQLHDDAIAKIETLRATLTAATELVTAVHDGAKEYKNRYGDLACLQFAIDLRLRGLK